ncbi:hypothetical protein GCM10010524_11280 [Streptomyces mexicanus]
MVDGVGTDGDLKGAAVIQVRGEHSGAVAGQSQIAPIGAAGSGGDLTGGRDDREKVRPAGVVTGRLGDQLGAGRRGR